MAALKLFLKLFIGVPLFIIGGIGLLGTLIGGQFQAALGIVAALAAFASICVWDSKRSQAKYRKVAERRGLTLDYFANYLDAGVVIDRQKRQLLLGKFDGGKIISFDDARSAEWEDLPYGGKMKYLLHVNTGDFDTPRLSVGFSGQKALRDQAYSKLMAALKLS
ncbi:hypothetical protein [Phytopseudomonas daroniae]|uniref:hypothetical protein n=1 Tax=Phytopseudomonas daroniae TaxID=2487519 RepID=UPI0010384E57|nr:hypothetical protein [Pseudomonas daroniae]TBU77177.1 hypothetical protein DNK10_06620 [Pseudomonas daroniae]